MFSLSLKKRGIDIFEFNSNLGLKRLNDYEPGVKKLPRHLKQNGFYEYVQPRRIFSLEPPEYQMIFDQISGVLNEKLVADYAIKQSSMLKEHFHAESFKLIIGGDCSILIGTALALKQHGNYALFFLDGHTDYVDTKISQTKAVAGMDLAIVTGWGVDGLTNIYGLKPYFEESNVYCVGNTELDEDYIAPILDSDIRYIDLIQLRNSGIQRIAEEFLEHVDKENVDGFFIHVDVDVLADCHMPAVDSRAESGLTYDELRHLLKVLLSHEKSVGMELTIFDPDFDEKGTIAKEFIHQIKDFFE